MEYHCGVSYIFLSQLSGILNFIFDDFLYHIAMRFCFAIRLDILTRLWYKFTKNLSLFTTVVGINVNVIRCVVSYKSGNDEDITLIYNNILHRSMMKTLHCLG